MVRALLPGDARKPSGCQRLLQKKDRVQKITSKPSGRWQDRERRHYAHMTMNEEEQRIEGLIERAEAGDEEATGILLEMIEELLAQGIGVPASILRRVTLH